LPHVSVDAEPQSAGQLLEFSDELQIWSPQVLAPEPLDAHMPGEYHAHPAAAEQAADVP